MLKPLHDYIWIEPITVNARRESGLVVVSRQDMKPTRGIVLAIGPGATDEYGELKPMPKVSVGSTICFTKDAVVEFTLEDKRKVVLVKAEHLIGVEELI